MMTGEKADGGSRQGGVLPDQPPGAAAQQADTPLSGIAEAFEEMAALLRSDEGGSVELRLDEFCDACSLVSVLFGCLGLAFKFAEMEYVAKVRDLVEASRTHRTLQNVLDLDVAKNSVRTPGSRTRNLRRVRQGLDLIRALFEQFLSSDDYSLKDAATTAYMQVCAPFHTWGIRTAVYAGMYTLPYRDQLLLKLNETDAAIVGHDKVLP
ncbi:ACD11 homolog protein-like isoform X2 [Rhodamnia argentea]|uniref:ACD11 homolog protein-like isoform X2 n=1 Tax=Rhodamnia argentea TaxID=178133 RepID=A0ABM3HDQ6_9MYRT|nr:ACD11 homolog protein-like isoform X2 [Rhodamnia argentea]